MLSHSAIWDAIDALAHRHGLSASGLARLAGLDSTAFNKSKRVSRDGRERWPSTESISKILNVTNETFFSFAAGAVTYDQGGGAAIEARIPMIDFALAESGGFFEPGGIPTGKGWDEMALPNAGEDGTFALEVSDDTMLPLYREGDVLIVSPGEQVRRGDRVIVMFKSGNLAARVLHRQTANIAEFRPLVGNGDPESIDLAKIDWIARILWASQ